MSVRATFNLRQFQKAIDKFTEDSEDDFEKTIEDVVEEIRDDAAAFTPVRTGRARDGWEIDKINDETYKVFNDVPYVIYLEHGTRYMRPFNMLGRAVQIARNRLGRKLRISGDNMRKNF